MGPITLTVLMPLVGALLLGLAPRARPRDVKAVGLVASLATFAASLWLLASFDRGNADLQLTEVYAWIPGIGASIAFAVDGVSLVLILLTTFLVPLILVASWRSIDDRFVGYTAAFEEEEHGCGEHRHVSGEKRKANVVVGLQRPCRCTVRCDCCPCANHGQSNRPKTNL